MPAEDIDTIIISHLHYDHAGELHRFPNAQFHLQATEMAFATGPCMCHPPMQMPYTADHVYEMVRRLYSGLRVKTEAGWLCLASDAAHYYKNFLAQKPFPIVGRLEHMIEGWKTVQLLASSRELVIPGHDPLVTRLFPVYGQADFA